MIQRIQSLFLLLAAVAAVLTFFYPIANFFSESYSLKLTVTGIEKYTAYSDTVMINTLPLMILCGLYGLLSLITVFLYKHRILQIRMARFAIFVDLVFLAIIFFYYIPGIEDATNATAEYISEAGIYFPLAALIFLLLAIRFITKDERKVKAADRIR